MLDGLCRVPSSRAKAVVSSPSTKLGKYFDFCSAFPPSSKRDAPNRAVANKGEGVRVFPASSKIVPIPIMPKSEPPYSSETRIPAHPRLAIFVHNSLL